MRDFATPVVGRPLANTQVYVLDTLLRQLYSELNPTRQRELMASLDAQLWKDLATVPLFAYPGLLITGPGVKCVQYNPNPQGVTFNANTWTVSSS